MNWTRARPLSKRIERVKQINLLLIYESFDSCNVRNERVNDRFPSHSTGIVLAATAAAVAIR